MELRPEPLPVPADWQTATSRAETLFGIHVNPYLTAAGVTEFTESVRAHVDTVADAAAVLVPRVELAYRHLGLPDDRSGRLATARAGASLIDALRRASSRVHLVQTLAMTELPATDTAVANSLSRAGQVAAAVQGFRWERLAPLRAAQDRADGQGMAAASTLRALRDAAAADEFATKLEPALADTDDAIFDWLADGQPAQPASATQSLRPDEVGIQLPEPKPLPGTGGRATRTKGTPSTEVLSQLAAFLEAHHDEQVIVEWRVQE